MSHIVNIFYNNRQDTIKLLDTHKPIVDYLGMPGSICPLLENSEITIKSELGRGEMGVVFDIEIPGVVQGRYAMKQATADIEIEKAEDISSLDNLTLDDIANTLYYKNNILPEATIAFNGGD